MAKQMIILRGPSGSGKSTFAKKTFPAAPILSTDDFWFTEDGTYDFQPSKIGVAHEWNQSRARRMVLDGEPTVVVDNTNTQLWEMKPYVEMAQKNGYELRFYRLKAPVDLCVERNVHGVPEKAVRKMAARMEDVPEAWGTETFVKGM